MTLFAVAVKSTFDAMLYNLAQASGYESFDFDGSNLSAAVIQSEAPAIAWSLLSLTPNPRDPYYDLQFEAGAKTSNDPTQYESMQIVGQIEELFPIGDALFIYDYSQTTPPTEAVGSLTITALSSVPSTYDQSSGLRMVHIAAKLMRF
jgi:hypothetical protein